MRLPWKREAIHTQPRPVNRKQLELEAAKAILSEVFQIRPVDVEEMLLERLEERSGHQKYQHQDGLWPATFCLGE
jgi:hypothetical protein